MHYECWAGKSTPASLTSRELLVMSPLVAQLCTNWLRLSCQLTLRSSSKALDPAP
jgi:hypothetical protein